MTNYAIVASRRQHPRFVVAIIETDIGDEIVVGRRQTKGVAENIISRKGNKVDGQWVWDERTGVEVSGTVYARGDDPDELLARIERAQWEWDLRTKIIDDLNESVRREVSERTLTEAAMLATPTKQEA